MSEHILSPAEFLLHWQGHRLLTRRVIEAFPADQLFSHHAPEMRHFGDLANEIYAIAAYTISGVTSGEWPDPSPNEEFVAAQDKASLLAAWDALTEQMNRDMPAVPPSRYAEPRKLFWGEKSVLGWALYALDNEIHHRGQGYVYLRELGVKPPDFFDR